MLWTVVGPPTSALTPQAVARGLDVVRRRLEDGAVHPATAFELIAAIRGVMCAARKT